MMLIAISNKSESRKLVSLTTSTVVDERQAITQHACITNDSGSPREMTAIQIKGSVGICKSNPGATSPDRR